MIELDGRVTEVLPGGMFRVDVSYYDVLATLTETLRVARTRVVVGDGVRVAVRSRDPSCGRIIWRRP